MYQLYPKFKAGQLAICHREAGVHFSKRLGVDGELIRVWDEEFLKFDGDEIPVYDYQFNLVRGSGSLKVRDYALIGERE